MNNPVTIVTGAGTGIGAAVCASLDAKGHRIVLAGRRIDKLTEVSATLNCESLVVQCDVRDEAEICRLVDETVVKCGKIDVLVNNAGMFQPTPIDQSPTELWDDIMATNLRSAFILSREAWPHLIASQGQIVNISSIAATMGFPGGAAYCASKFGMNGLSAVLTVEGKPHGIRVLTVCPAQVATPIWGDRAEPVQLDRMMTPAQIAKTVVWMVTSPRNMKFEPVVVSNFSDPWDEE